MDMAKRTVKGFGANSQALSRRRTAARELAIAAWQEEGLSPETISTLIRTSSIRNLNKVMVGSDLKAMIFSPAPEVLGQIEAEVGRKLPIALFVY
jgi:hypothetical protein